MKRIHLLCNAHLDPTWLWEWEDGAAAAVSTFRVAADFCEEFEGFIFNHNEAILYKWVEEYEPSLFKRIQRLVGEGKWHIMGGWYLQPDCNMPSGESFVRQILIGKSYFKEKFGVEPATAINFDSFGHTRGLVQILKKSGYHSYIHARPDNKNCPLPAEDYIWAGYDGSEVMVHRMPDGYGTGEFGKALDKIKKWLEGHRDVEAGLILWGVGNHGGGPSRIDLNNIADYIRETKEYTVLHSTPEDYFEDLKIKKVELPVHQGDLNPVFKGCYTSQVRLKQNHRQLENYIFMTEKMFSNACIQGYSEYPQKEIHEALCDLAYSEFHDILAGSSIQLVEENALRLLDHGIEILARLKAKAFFALSAGQEKAKEDEIPVLVYNPHPFKVKGVFECEFLLAGQNWTDEYFLPVLYKDNTRLPSQIEKEHCNINLDWMKHLTFIAELEPSQMNRFDCKIEKLAQKPQPRLKEEDGRINFKTEELEVVISCSTGLVDIYRVNGVDCLKENSFCPIVLSDSDDSWDLTNDYMLGGMDHLLKVIGKFELMSREDGTKFSGVKDEILDSVRVIEDGAARTVVEAVFSYGDSFMCQTYKLPKHGTEIEVEVKVYWNEKTKLLKLSVPTLLTDGKYFGQVAYGVEEFKCRGDEVVSQKWAGVVSEDKDAAFTCINDGIYGSDYNNGEIRLTLLRSPAYSALTLGGDRALLVQDRFFPRIDQGERHYKFWFNAGKKMDIMEQVDRQALVHNEKPFVLSFFPSGEGKKPETFIKFSDDSVQMTAFKKAEGSEDYIIRIFEPTGNNRSFTMELPAVGLTKSIKIERFEIKTLRLDVNNKTLTEVDLLERLS